MFPFQEGTHMWTMYPEGEEGIKWCHSIPIDRSECMWDKSPRGTRPYNWPICPPGHSGMSTTCIGSFRCGLRLGNRHIAHVILRFQCFQDTPSYSLALNCLMSCFTSIHVLFIDSILTIQWTSFHLFILKGWSVPLPSFVTGYHHLPFPHWLYSTILFLSFVFKFFLTP